ncbi:MAG: hypothetical protein JWN00_2552 [Actinomycetia bacterium]|nr:hypothetical protein [Actinomycetes bacterium]
MVDVKHDRLTFDAAALLDMLERSFSSRLRQVSLVTEVDVSEVMIDAAADALGRVYRRSGDRELARRWPGCVAVALTGVASARCEPGHRQGTYWRHWWAACHVRGRAQDGTAFGETFLAALRVFGLPTFPELGETQKYLGPIMMHAGIPTHCLADFFRFLLSSRAQESGLDLEAVLARVSGGRRIGGVSEPVRRFLQYGGDYAQDVIDRCMELLERLGAEGEPDLAGLGLPARIVEQAQALARDGLLEIGWQVASAERPRIALDPFGQGIHLVLPRTQSGSGPHDPGRAADGWTVTIGGVTTEVRSHPLGPVTPCVLPLPRPAPRVQVTQDGSAGQTELDLVDPADPLLIFTEGGRFVPPHQALPPEAVWVAHPGDREPATGAGGPARVIAESRLPLGWEGWRLTQISLDGAAWLALSGDGAPRRAVRGQHTPRLLTGEPLPGVSTPDGSPVLSGLPAVWLPGGSEACWLISVRRSTGGPPVFTGSRTALQPVEVTGLWAGALRPVLGTFVITVRGPIGRGIRRTVTIAEGLGVRCDPPVRLFRADGLAPARAWLSAGPGMAVTPQTPVLSPQEPDRTVTCATHGESMPLVVTPPHMRVFAERAAGQGEWSAGPLRLDTGELDEIEALRIEIPGVTTAFPLGVVVGGCTVQEVGRSVRGRYSLWRVRDTVTAHGGADLVVPAGVVCAEAVPVASIYAAAAGDPWLSVEWSPRRTP